MRSSRTGFTLVELMVALVVGGFVVAAGHQMLNATVDAARRSQERREPALAAATSRLMLTDWLSSAFLTEEDGLFRGVRRVEVGAHADELTFTSSDGGPLHPGPHRIRLWVERRSSAPRRGVLAEVVPLPALPGAPADTLDLAPTATGLAVRYLIQEDRRTQWRSEWQSEVQLPLAIEVRLEALARARLGGGPDPAGLPPVLALPLLVRVAVENW